MIRTLQFFICCFLTFNVASAQSFTVQHDTVYLPYTGPLYGLNGIIVPPGSPVTIKWRVLNTNFPPDWMPPSSTGFCDNQLCYDLAHLWPSAVVNSTAGIVPTGSDTDGISYSFNLETAVTYGTFYITLRLHNAAIPADTATQTYVISKFPPATLSSMPRSTVIVYPNPGTGIIIVSGAGVKGLVKFELSDMSGRRVLETTDQTHIDTRGLPAGLYILKGFDVMGAEVHCDKLILE
ncbi:MAG: T9SS type A sorting domain-containing protein [Bacteroidota bacterium]